MTIYAAIPLANNIARLSESVSEVFPDDNINTYALPSGAGFLINFSGTNQELCDKLFITQGKTEEQKSYVGSTLVVPFDYYWGVGNSSMWEWLKARFEE